MNWSDELGILVFFGKKNPRQTHRIKITQFGLVFAKTSRSKIRGYKSITNRKKMIKFHKIKLIYASQLESNVTR